MTSGDEQLAGLAGWSRGSAANKMTGGKISGGRITGGNSGKSGGESEGTGNSRQLFSREACNTETNYVNNI